MIRRISVPPFEALDPLLPRRAGSDPETRETVAGSQRKPPSISPASAGSPIQPRPREASVMPSWVAEM